MAASSFALVCEQMNDLVLEPTPVLLAAAVAREKMLRTVKVRRPTTATPTWTTCYGESPTIACELFKLLLVVGKQDIEARALVKIQ